MRDDDRAIRVARMTLGAVLEKRRAKEAVRRADGQVFPSKYLPDVPRQFHAYGGRANEKSDIWWHGSPSGDLRGGTSGLHLGTKEAALDALRARIGVPADGSMWDGTKEYGKTLLAGKKTLNRMGRYLITGHNVGAPEEDYYPHQHPGGMPTVGNGVPVDPSWKPFLRPFKIVGPMTNTPWSPHGDSRANAMMKASLTRGNAKNGYYYKNDGEDSGSISAVVPNGSHVEPVDQDSKYANGGPVGMLPVPRLAVAPQLQTQQRPSAASYLTSLASLADTAGTVFGKEPQQAPQEPHAARAEAGHEGISPEAAAAMEALRANWSGQDFGIVSGYRNLEQNIAAKGAKGSQHMHGNAFDVDTTGWTPEQKLALATEAYNAGFRGFGFYGNNLHFDVADPRAWGPSHSRDSIPDWAQPWTEQYLGYADGGSVDDGKVVYQGRSKKGIQQFFNPNGHAWGTTDLGTAKLFAGQSEATYPNATPRRAETSYNGEVHKLRFHIKNPMRVDIKETLWDANKEKAKIEEAKAKGHDGLEIYHNPNKSDFVAFSPDQVEHLGSSTPETTVDHYADGGAAYTPQKTVKAYKLFRTKGDGKLYPLFVHADKPVPMGQWLEAEEGPRGKAEGKVKSKLGDLAYRPGWHAGNLPMATHIGGKSDPSLKKPDYRPDNHVWAEVEMAADKDWQSVADSRGKGVKAHITDQVPYGGFYRYKTNPNMTGNWLIGGHMKVNRVLSDDEVKAINDAAGTADLPRRSEGFADGGAAMFEGMSEHLMDDEGKPMELWHGTPGAGFEAFDDAKLGRRDAGFYGRGHYLTPIKGNAEGYADPDEMGTGTVMGPMHAALKNPYVWDVSDDNKAHSTLRDLQSMGIMKGQDRMEPWDNLQRHHIDPFMAEMKRRGHDGVIYKTGQGVKEVVVFKPTAIKHRDAEVGDPNDPRIMRAKGGMVERALAITRRAR